MAYFAEIKDGIVQRVIVVSNSDIMENGKESEAKGIAFCKALLGKDTEWVQTSYNATIRKNYAGPGFLYDKDRDAFLPPKPYPSWVLNEEKCVYYPPEERPLDGKDYLWDEKVKAWEEDKNDKATA